ncbi:hypothetical protein OG552_21240 [Streptomyces sp. NBC_01476]|uniref:hypothetical protein n=1 Tax=Streptomyces sp. NBC_01476 TaxID=2903881 RepID=UPI002E2FBFF3|nr:hypothetical protein [Streptomyces sp. NBC_01476]
MAVIAAGSAACGTAQAGSPQGKVENAFTKLGDQKALTVGASFDASADQIWSALRGEDDFTKADATLLAGLHAQYAVSADRPLTELTSGDKNVSLGVLLSDDPAGKKNLIEVRQVADALYLRADVKALEQLDTTATGKNDGDLDKLLGGTDGLPSSLGALKSALDGKWISIDKKFLDSLSALGGPGTSGLDATSQAQLVTTLKNALLHNAKFKDLGSHDGADHVRVDVPAQQFAKELKPGLSTALKGVPGFSAAQLDRLDDVPAKTVTADLAISDGMVSGITVDVAQFDSKAPAGKLPLALTFTGGAAKITAPAGATSLDPQDLFGLIASGLTPGGKAPSSAGIDQMLKNLDLSGLSPDTSTGTTGTSDAGFFNYTPLT